MENCNSATFSSSSFSNTRSARMKPQNIVVELVILTTPCRMGQVEIAESRESDALRWRSKCHCHTEMEKSGLALRRRSTAHLCCSLSVLKPLDRRIQSEVTTPTAWLARPAYCGKQLLNRSGQSVTNKIDESRIVTGTLSGSHEV